MLAPPTKQSELDHLLRGIDLNHDNKIQLPEFLATMLDWDMVQAEQSWKVRGGGRH